MNADAFRHLYDYHFAENRKLWESCVVALSDEAFALGSEYSRGSVRDQVLHLIEVDEAWFGGLRGDPAPEPSDAEPTEPQPPEAPKAGPAGAEPPPPEPPTAPTPADRDSIRARWDGVEERMREYLAQLRDDMLDTRPFTEGEDADLRLWQILIHVVNHGTDHRAQLLRQLHDLGVRTESQDYVFHAYEHPLR